MEFARIDTAWRNFILPAALLFASCFNALGEDTDQKDAKPTAEQEEFFEQKVLPILTEHCFECHGGGKKIRGELVMTNRHALLEGGESGPAIDLEKPLKSLLLEAINYESVEMPPDGKLAAAKIETIEKWVEMGAPWKGDGFEPKSEEEEMAPPVNEKTKSWWSYQPVVRPDAPKVKQADWPTNEIDYFILANLEQAGFAPAKEASRETLIRRVSYDLTGLPPTPKEIEEFVRDDTPDAYEKLIDRLLASPHYGEKWGRHWLDVVRYAETNSYERDGMKPFVWKYRDYVINSFNNDKPYDQFLREQLAGDELDNVTPETIIATGYYRLGIWDDEPVSQEQAWFDDMDDVLATTAQSMLGMTIDCARCHDHKIDPIPQVDYYKMLSFFRNIQRYGIRGHDTVLRHSVRDVSNETEKKQFAGMIAEHEAKIKDVESAMKEIEEIVKKDFIPVEHEEFKHDRNKVALVRKRGGSVITKEQAQEYKKLFDERNHLRRNPPKAMAQALCVTERGADAPDTFVTIRGNAEALGEKVMPGFPQVLSPPEPEISLPDHKQSTGRRLALANWIASDKNPLAARVIVNRIWQHHFGRGIVRSANDFGFQGTPPTHPQLLDWLASDFVEGDWKMKRMHKLMMMSSTYRMSSQTDDETIAADPLNDHFSRFNLRRLTAEEVRDSILAVNGKLNRKLLGQSIFPVLPREVLHGQSRPGADWNTSSGEDLDRRSVYIHIKRSLPVPILQNFDIASPDSSCPVRFNTTQPAQALTMLNSDFLNKEAERFAERLRTEQPDDTAAQVTAALNLVLQRLPTQVEVTDGMQLIEELNEEHQVSSEKALEHFCLICLNLNEFIYLD